MTVTNQKRLNRTVATESAALRTPATAWLAAAALMVGSVLLYLPSFGHDFIRGYDDSTYILDNPPVLDGLSPSGVAWAFTTTYAVNWLPLTWLSHMLDVSAYGLNPVGHHATSIVLHGLNAALLLLALRRLTCRLWPSLAVAVLFAVHPLRVESVSWVAERKDVLSGAFFLAALWAYGWYTERPDGRRYALVAALHALGLMSKTMLVTFPFVLLLLDWWPLRRVAVGRWLPLSPGNAPLDGRSADAARPTVTVRRAVLEKVPLLALSVSASAWTFLFQKEGGAMEFGATLSLADRLSTAVVCVPRYLAATFWPSGLAVLYPHPGHWPAWEVAAAGALIVLVTAACWLVRRRVPYLLVGWLWFLGMLVPVSGIVQVGFQSMADRYFYLPGIGLTVAVVWLAMEVLRGRGPRATGIAGPEPSATHDDVAATGRRPARWVAPACVVVVAGALCVVTVRQQFYWADSFTLFTRALAVTEGNWMAHGHVGTGLYLRGDERGAVDHFREALRINPEFANAHYNLGLVAGARGKSDEAIAEYREAIRLNPGHYKALYELGDLYLTRKQMPAEAVGPLAEATRLKPGWPAAEASLARALAASGRSAEATDRIRQSAGGSADAQIRLGITLLGTRRLPEATDAFREAVRLEPDNAAAHFHLGYALGQAGQYYEAEREVAEAVRLDPRNPKAAMMLQNLRSRPGR